MTSYWENRDLATFMQGKAEGYRQGYRHGIEDGIKECDLRDQLAQEEFTRAAAKSAQDAISIHAAREATRRGENAL
ncbi:hypothetical protein [Glutamicibacter uratoxydans]|uniref:hypothetical protein n=1 Tax=Glutamicibacter uratoxydans TaxID=43667 RepID=UPI003D6EDD40